MLAQSPRTGSSVRTGGKVDLTVAQAPKEVDVPNVVGAAEVAAAAALEHAGFKVEDGDPRDHRTGPGGRRARTEPGGRPRRARKGATVTIVVGMLAPTTTTTTTTTTPTTTTTATTPTRPRRRRAAGMSGAAAMTVRTP